jgi:uncharacterized SAM-binding protein YcdF (DUF218 family)
LLLLVLFGLAGWLVSAVFRTTVLTTAGAFLVKEDGPRKTDAIVVLGGDEFGTRAVKGAELAQAGYAPYVLVSAPTALLGNESDATIEYAKRKGFSAALFRPTVLPPDAAESTRTEATYLGNYLKKNGVRSILLVTSNFHTRRAGNLWRHANPWLNIAVVAAPDKYFTPETWWKSRGGKKTFLLEWMKTVNTWAGM